MSRYLLAYLPCFWSPFLASPFATLTRSLFRHPLPTKASLGWRYLKKCFLMTESEFTLMPTCSSSALMFVSSRYSPPSCITTKQLPPASMYCFIVCSSWPVKGILGAPSSSRCYRYRFSMVNSPLLISYYTNEVSQRVWRELRWIRYLVSSLELLNYFFEALVRVQHFFLARVKKNLQFTHQ